MLFYSPLQSHALPMLHIIVLKSVKGMMYMRKTHPCPYCTGNPMYDPDYMHNPYIYQCPCSGIHAHGPDFGDPDEGMIKLMDYGPGPFAIDIEEAAEENNNFRMALWTGKHLQTTLMSIKVGDDIGLEIHPNTDQFIRIEEGQGIVKMGDREDRLDFQRKVSEDYAIFIPAGKWHNLINTGNRPIKLYSIYAPPQHPKGTVHRTKAEAEAAEHSSL